MTWTCDLCYTQTTDQNTKGWQQGAGMNFCGECVIKEGGRIDYMNVMPAKYTEGRLDPRMSDDRLVPDPISSAPFFPRLIWFQRREGEQYVCAEAVTVDHGKFLVISGDQFLWVQVEDAHSFAPQDVDPFAVTRL